MSLVADYGSDSEGNDSNEGDLLDLPHKRRNIEFEENEKKTVENEEQSNEIISQNNLFSKLPQRKSEPSCIGNSEDQIEDFIPKCSPVKPKEKVKISIPSLSDFKNCEEDYQPNEKKFKHSFKGCGLLSLLPPVKGSVKTAKSFVPNVVANKNKLSVKLQSKKISKEIQEEKILVKQKVQPPTKEKKLIFSDVESEDEDIEIPETFDDEMWQKVCGRPKLKRIIKEPEPVIIETSVDIAPEPEKPYDGLNNEAFKELVGKTKRPIGNIKLIDINEEEILADKDLWMTKSLTDPEMAPKATVENPVDPTRRKKHHITYLAQQAKANEQELANAWAASKNNRLASRAKYGF